MFLPVVCLSPFPTQVCFACHRLFTISHTGERFIPQHSSCTPYSDDLLKTDHDCLFFRRSHSVPVCHSILIAMLCCVHLCDFSCIHALLIMWARFYSGTRSWRDFFFLFLFSFVCFFIKCHSWAYKRTRQSLYHITLDHVNWSFKKISLIKHKTLKF